MRVFAALGRHQTLSAAARALGMPKQTVSRRLAALEQELGTSLFVRSTRALRLTEVGQRYAERCAEIVRAADVANDEVSADAATPAGRLRITADPTFGESFLAPLIAEFTRAHPLVRLEVRLTNKTLDLIAEGIDVAFRVGQVGDAANIRGRVLAPARMTYCASPDYLAHAGTPTAPHQLADHRTIALSPDLRPIPWPFHIDGRLQPIAVDAALRLDSMALARQAALAGLGITNLPSFCCAADIARGDLTPLFEQATVDVGSVWLLWPEQTKMSPALRAFVDAVVGRVATLGL